MRSLFALILIASPALGDVSSGGRTIECYCTDTSGGRVELGQTICLKVDGRMFMAQCQMALNVPMWREVAQGCLSSSLSPQDAPGLPASPLPAPG